MRPRFIGWCALLSVFATISGALADEIPLMELALNPQSFVGTRVVIAEARCADVGSAFVCSADIGSTGELITVRATGMGLYTGSQSARKLAFDCKGEASLQKENCSFRLAFTPVSQGFGVPVEGVKARLNTHFTSRTMDFFAPLK